MILQFILNGIVIGGVYALVALGYTLIYGVLKFINFAHGEIFMVGAYFSYLFLVVLKLNFILAFLLSVMCTALLGMAIEKVAYRPLRNASRLAPLISALGVSIVLQNVVAFISGSGARSITGGKHDVRVFHLGGAALSSQQIVIICCSVLVMIALSQFLARTKTGRATRAVAADREAAAAVGINCDRMISYTFAGASGLAAVAGILVALSYDMTPTMGVLMGFKGFTASVVGGIGNIPGAMIGGYIIGVVENLVAGYTAAQLKNAIAFLILILVLVFRPRGLLGIARREA